MRSTVASDHGRARTAHSTWSDAHFELSTDALVIHRVQHPQPRVRIALDRVRRLDRIRSDDRVVEVSLVTTVGSVLRCTWSSAFCEQVVETLGSTLDRPPGPTPVPLEHLVDTDAPLWVPTLGSDSTGVRVVGPPLPHRYTARRRRRRHRIRTVLVALTSIVALLGADLFVIHARIERVHAELPDAPDGVRTWLLVGSDSRAAATRLGRAETFGSVEQVPGERADVVLLVQEGGTGRPARVVSVPRDLLVFRRDHGVDRLALTLLDGPTGLVVSVCRSLGIPVDHVVTIRFDGLAGLVDMAGGIEVRTDAPTRDLNTGLDLPAGTSRLDGADAIAWMRSRHIERFVGHVWVPDPSSDTGRQEHQRDVLDQLIRRLGNRAGDPLRAQRIAWTAAGALSTDGATGPVDLARLALALRTADAGQSIPHALVDGRIPVATLTGDATHVIDGLRNGREDGPPCPRPALTP